MIDNVKPTKIARLDDHRRGGGPTEEHAAPPPPSPPAITAPPAPESDIRLLIERSLSLGVYVYTLIDRTSGRVLASIPRPEVEAMGSSEDYKAGAVVSTKV